MAFSSIDFTSLTESAASTTGSNLSTGDLRRAYGLPWSANLTELSPQANVLLRLLLKMKGRKVPVDDADFKYWEQRNSWHKRYAYVTAHGTDASVSTTGDATVTASNIAAGSTYFFKMGTDYLNAGNVSSVYGQSGSEVTIGDANTRPNFFMEGQTIKIPFGSAYNTHNDYILGKVQGVTNVDTTHVILEIEVTKTLKTATNNELQWKSATAPMDETYGYYIAAQTDSLETKRSYVVGSAFAPGSGLPDQWVDNPYSSAEGKTQIFKNKTEFDGTTKATRMKFAGNEMRRMWANIQKDHEWDINHAILFESLRTDADGARHTEGIVDFIINYGNVFSLTHSSKTQDDFLNDMSQFYDPRVGGAQQSVFLADTYTYNWLNQLSGYFANTIQLTPNYRAGFSFVGKNIPLMKKLGLDANIINTPYGDMNVIRDVHLDSSPVKLIAVNMSNVRLRPLVYDGENRDTSMYYLDLRQTTGEDKVVWYLMTECGLEPALKESHAVWL